MTQSQQITDGQTYTSSYEYNLSGALVKQTYPSGRVVQNDLESEIEMDAQTHPTINAATNRFLANQGYTYDLNGNLIQDAEGRQFTFNGDNKQTLVMNGAVKVGEYFYDGEGKRIKKKTFHENGVEKETTVFVYSGGKLIAEYSTIPPPSEGKTKYLTEDHLGTPRIITDATGQVIARRDFLPFGENVFVGVGERSATQQYGANEDDVRQKFTGYQEDKETGLDFAEARMYANQHGRFTAVDPLLASGKSANPQTFNRYVYVGNNPINITDPLGLEWYFNSGENRYDWYDDESGKFTYSGDDYKVNWDNWKIVEGGADAFKYLDNAAQDGTFVALDRFSEKFTTGLSEGDALSRATALYNSSPSLRDLSSGVSQGIEDAKSGSAKGAGNFFIDIANGTLTFYFNSQYPASPTPQFFQRYNYDTLREAKYGTAVETAAFLAPGPVKVGAFSKAGRLSAVPRTTTFTVTKNGVVLPHPKYNIPSTFIENPNRAGSYGEILNGKFVERIRIDPATPKYPTHYHRDGGKEHLFPGSSKGDPGFR